MAIDKKCLCKYCGKIFLAWDKKASICPECKEERSKCPNCGNKKTIISATCVPCARKKWKGKTYLEIYGTSSPKCGFKKGKDNYNFAPGSKEKRSEGVKRSYKNPELIKQRRERMISRIRSANHPMWYYVYNEERGEGYQSRLEESFAKLLQKYSFEYIKDYPLALSSTQTKLIDFMLVQKEYFIEISGFAFPRWQNDFIDKMKKVFEVLKNKRVIIFTYPEKLETLKERSKEFQLNSNKLSLLSTEEFESFLLEENK